MYNTLGVPLQYIYNVVMPLKTIFLLKLNDQLKMDQKTCFLKPKRNLQTTLSVSTINVLLFIAFLTAKLLIFCFSSIKDSKDNILLIFSNYTNLRSTVSH